MIFLQGNKFTREKQMDIWFLNSIQCSGHISYPILPSYAHYPEAPSVFATFYTPFAPFTLVII